MDMNNTPADVSSFLLFEVTGDSEAHSDPVVDDVAHAITTSDDDAQSCSDDASESFNLGEVNRDETCDADDEKMKEDEDEVCVYGTSCYEDDEVQENHESGVSVDSGPELVDEMEKNKKFWETCLAS